MDLYAEDPTEFQIDTAPGQGEGGILLTNSSDSDAHGSSACDDLTEKEFDIDINYAVA